MTNKKKEEETPVGAVAEAGLETVPAVAETPVAAPETPVQTGPVTVYYRDHRGRGAYRVFSQDVHGDNFAALAEEFKATNATKIIADEAEGKAAVQEAAKLE